MKWLIVPFLVVVINQIAWAHIESGTVIFVERDKDVVTIGADSRATGSTTGEHNDCYCKIAAFGDKFLFTFAGIVEDDSHTWSADSVAFRAWKIEDSKHVNAEDLVEAVAARWNANIAKIYRDPELIRGHGKAPLIAQPVFVATDNAGSIAAINEDVSFDSQLFDSMGKIEIVFEKREINEGQTLSLGRNDTITEYMEQSNERVKEDFKAFKADNAFLGPEALSAALVSHLITRAIQLDPHRDELALPVDVIQLKAKSGVHFVEVKRRCKVYDPKINSRPCHSNATRTKGREAIRRP